MARILVVDDESPIRDMFRRILEPEGHEVVEASNGNEALQALQETSFDLVITDINMPFKDGIETIIDLRRNYPEIKIIAISGGGAAGIENHLEIAQRIGAHEVFRKPLKLKNIADAISKLLDQ